MSNLRLAWTLPTERVLGEALPPAQISLVEVQMSADGGATYNGLFQETDTSVLERLLEDVDPGTYFFRGVVEDTEGRRSIDFDIQSDTVLSAPNGLGTFTVTIE